MLFSPVFWMCFKSFPACYLIDFQPCGKCFTFRMAAPKLRQKFTILTNINTDYKAVRIRKSALEYPVLSAKALQHAIFQHFAGFSRNHCAKIAPILTVLLFHERK